LKFNDNPYYSPELCGLEIFEEIDTADSYEFDKLVVWKKNDDGSLWWDCDSGCSCPSPFDNSDNGHDLKQITHDTVYNFDLALKNHGRITTEQYIATKKKVVDYLFTRKILTEKAKQER
jgi:hypothetical protein